MPSFGPSTELGQAVLAQRLPGGHQGSARRDDLANADQRPERVGELDDLARGRRACAGHGRHDATVEQIGEAQAQPGRHGGVARKERQQPDRDDRPGIRRAQPRRTAGGPGQQQVALVGSLLLLGQANRGQCADAGVTPYTGRPSCSARRAWLQCRCTVASRAGAMLTAWPAATALTKPRSALPASVIASAGLTTGTAASFRCPAARPGAG